MDIDKCDVNFGIRIPKVLQRHLENLTRSQKRQLNSDLLDCMARAVHAATYKPELYLTEQKVNANDAKHSSPSFSLESEAEE